MRGLAAALAILLVSDAALADEAFPVNKAISGDQIALQDGRVVRLAGIKAAEPDAENFLEATVLGHAVVLQDAAPDRYGRTSAVVSVQGNSQSVEDQLLTAGLAFVYPAEEDDRLEVWMQLEHAARQGKRGFWAVSPDVPATDGDAIEGKYAFVVGTVTKAERVKNKVYVDFGADRQKALTVVIAAHNLRAFKKQDLDPLEWQGKKLRLRGWVTHNAGPTLTLTDPHQVEIVQ